MKLIPLFALLLAASQADDLHTEVIEYKQGKYQGKPDEPPYAAAPFNGNKDQWERDIRNRTQNQNEYRRIGT